MGKMSARDHSLHAYVVDQIGQRIASGELTPNSKILPETLGTEFGVSRTVVREALRDLQAKGMVRPRPKTGTRVLPVTEWNLLDEQVIGWRVRSPARQEQLRELMELRSHVELAAIRSACSVATAADLVELLRCCDAMETGLSAGNLTEFTEADIAFHTALLAASGNLVFRQFSVPFAAVLRARDDLHLLPEYVEFAVVEVHRQVLAAITSGDADEAERVANELIVHACSEMGLV
jgi:DNA-binding FadR family transcriptional regulator